MLSWKLYSNMTKITDAKFLEARLKFNRPENGFVTGPKLQLFQCEAGKDMSLLCPVGYVLGMLQHNIFENSCNPCPRLSFRAQIELLCLPGPAIRSQIYVYTWMKQKACHRNYVSILCQVQLYNYKDQIHPNHKGLQALLSFKTIVRGTMCVAVYLIVVHYSTLGTPYFLDWFKNHFHLIRDLSFLKLRKFNNNLLLSYTFYHWVDPNPHTPFCCQQFMFCNLDELVCQSESFFFFMDSLGFSKYKIMPSVTRVSLLLLQSGCLLFLVHA